MPRRTPAPERTHRGLALQLLAALLLATPAQAGTTFINAELVRGGFARADPHPPDTAFANLFSQLEKEAQAARRGLWGACPRMPLSGACPNPSMMYGGMDGTK